MTSLTSSHRINATPRNRIPFLDLADIESQHHVVQRVITATKHSLNPVLPVGDIEEFDAYRCSPWEARAILYDDQERLFKCWYAAVDLRGAR